MARGTMHKFCFTYLLSTELDWLSLSSSIIIGLVYTWNWNKNDRIGRIGRIGRNQFNFDFQNGRNGWIRLLHKKLII